MSYFPQPDPAKRAKRVKLGSSVKVTIRLDGASAIRAKLYELSATGGLLALSKPFEQGDFVEVEFETSQGKVHAMRRSQGGVERSPIGARMPPFWICR